MERKSMTDVKRRVRHGSVPGLSDRRDFLAGAGKYGALLVGGACLAAADAEGLAQVALDGPGDTRAVQEKAMAVRVFGLVQRAPGLTRAELRRKSFLPLHAYYSGVFQDAIKMNDSRSQLIHIENFVTDAAFGADGQMQCSAVVNRDFVAELSYGVGDTKVGNMAGQVDVPRTQGERRRVAAFPDSGERGTDISVVARQVLAQGTRPLSPSARIDKAMHFIKLSATVAAADQVKIWQTLHAKALEAAPAFAAALVGHEVLQRLPDLPPRQPSRCGAEMPVADLVACFWFKTKQSAAQFPGYVRALRQADQQGVIDAPASFFVLVDEVEVWTNPSFIG
jgi:hypothetical protein